MSHVQSNEEIAPYLNPNYWDGHTLGVGEPTEDAGVISHSSSNDRYARAVIADRIKSPAVLPIRTFQHGCIFDPGTIVLMRQDVLYGDSIENDYDIDALRSLDLPERSIDTSPSFGMLAPILLASDEKRHYISHIRWGVVVRGAGKSALSSVPASSVDYTSEGIKITTPFVSMYGATTIGETEHRAVSEHAPERLIRVNTLHVVAQGTPEKQRRSVFSILGKPAVHGA